LVESFRITFWPSIFALVSSEEVLSFLLVINSRSIPDFIFRLYSYLSSVSSMAFCLEYNEPSGIEISGPPTVAARHGTDGRMRTNNTNKHLFMERLFLKF
jgi:hypothetical protein